MSTLRIRCAASAAMVACMACSQMAHAQLIFSDTFEDSRGASLLWGNERGAWRIESAIGVAGGAYGAGQPTNAPPTFSSMPYRMGNCVVEFDVRSADDGGVWLHADDAGLNGVLFVMARGNIYWHHMSNGNAGAVINPVNGVFTVGQSVHVRLVVEGNNYYAFVNGSQMPMTQYNTAAFPIGRVGLYDFKNPNHQYDNVTLSGTCDSGVCCPAFAWQPADVTQCPGGIAVLSAPLAGNQTMTSSQWYWTPRDIGVPQLVVEGLNLNGQNQPAFVAQGANTTALSLSLASGAAQTAFENFECRVNGPCGPLVSNAADVRFCAADFNCDRVIDLFDYLDFVASFSANEPSADFNADGVIDFFDYLDFVASFAGGC
jgi:hypothetical protein